MRPEAALEANATQPPKAKSSLALTPRSRGCRRWGRVHCHSPALTFLSLLPSSTTNHQLFQPLSLTQTFHSTQLCSPSSFSSLLLLQPSQSQFAASAACAVAAVAAFPSFPLFFVRSSIATAAVVDTAFNGVLNYSLSICGIVFLT